jgi:hypothetical protein
MPESRFISPDSIKVQPHVRMHAGETSAFKENRQTREYQLFYNVREHVESAPAAIQIESFPAAEQARIATAFENWKELRNTLIAELEQHPDSARALELEAAVKKHEETHFHQQSRFKASDQNLDLALRIDSAEAEENYMIGHLHVLESRRGILIELQAMLEEIKKTEDTIRPDAFLLSSYQTLFCFVKARHLSTMNLLYFDLILQIMEQKVSLATIPWHATHIVASVFLLFGVEIYDQDQLIRLPDEVATADDPRGCFLNFTS